MAKKLSSLFLSTIRRATRLQAQVIEQAARAATKPAKRPKRKGGTKAKVDARAKQHSSATVRPKAGEHALAPGAGSWQNFVHETRATRTELLGRLAYALYRPAPGSLSGRPLVLMLHGCQQTPADFAQGSQMNRLASRENFVVAYPQQMRRVDSMRCWRWFRPTAGEGLAEADAIADLARALVRQYRLDAGRVYVAGLSAGAGMAALAALRHPDVFSAVAMHSGAVIGAAHDALSGVRAMRKASAGDPVALLAAAMHSGGSSAPVPAIILHGRRDRVVSERNAFQLAAQFCSVNGVAAATERVLAEGTHREYFRRDYVRAGRSIVRLCLLEEVGHAWSGGDGKVKFHAAKGPTASLLIWRFFSMHARASP